MPGAICSNRWFFWSLEIFGLFFISTEIRLIDNFRWRQLVKVFLLLLPVNWPDPFPLNLRTWVDVESSLILTQLTYNLLIFFSPFPDERHFQNVWGKVMLFENVSWPQIWSNFVFYSQRFSPPLGLSQSRWWGEEVANKTKWCRHVGTLLALQASHRRRLQHRYIKPTE